MSAISEVIASVLRSDIHSRSASSVLSDPRNAELLPSGATSADVPDHTTKCLLELFTGKDQAAGGDPQWLIDHVVTMFGAGLTQKDGGIDIFYTAGDQGFVNYGLRDDSVGAKVCALRIAVNIGSIGLNPDETVIYAAETITQRIEYVLDSLTRGEFRGGTNLLPDIDPRGIDKSLDSKYKVKAQYIQDVAEPTATEHLTLWRIQYKLLHLY